MVKCNILGNNNYMKNGQTKLFKPYGAPNIQQATILPLSARIPHVMSGQESRQKLLFVYTAYRIIFNLLNLNW